MITVHIEIKEVEGGFNFRPSVSGIPTENEKMVANQVLVHVARLLNPPVESQAPQGKPKRRRHGKNRLGVENALPADHSQSPSGNEG